MTVAIDPKRFNGMVRSMKPIVNAKSPRAYARRAHLSIFEPAPGSWYLRLSATDGVRVAEDTLSISEPSDLSGPAYAPMNLPRLAATGPVEIRMDPDRLVISFDDVAFTTVYGDRCLGQQSLDIEPMPAADPIRPVMEGIKLEAARKPGRTSILCNPKYLAQAVGSLKDVQKIRIDTGGPIDPILLTGYDREMTKIRAVLPMRSTVTDKEYREQLAKTVIPKPEKEETQP